MTVFDTVGLVLAGLLAFLLTFHITLVVVVLTCSHIQDALQRSHSKLSGGLSP